MNEGISLVYFSSVTENTKKFVERLGFKNERIPLKASEEPLIIDYKYVLFVPTYGGGDHEGAVPKQVIKFLNVEQNRNNCIGLITSGNINFGEGYGLAGKIISQKINVPILYLFELAGTKRDEEIVRQGLINFWKNI